MYRSDKEKIESLGRIKASLNPSSNGCTVLTAKKCLFTKKEIGGLNPSSNGCTVLTASIGNA